MAVGASILVRAAILVVIDEILRSPIPTLLVRVKIDLGLPSEILPVMCKNTLISLVVGFVVRAPDRFEMENVKVWIFLKFVNQLYRNLRVWMSKGTEVSILAFSFALDVRCAKFSFVFVRMVEFLNSIVSFLATLTLITSLMHILAKLWRVGTQGSPLILFLVMVVRTSLQVVCVGVGCAGVDLELSQIQEGAKILVSWSG